MSPACPHTRATFGIAASAVLIAGLTLTGSLAATAAPASDSGFGSGSGSSPNVRYNDLTGVVTVAPDDAWSVGTAVVSSGLQVPVVLHWDGSQWTTRSFHQVDGQLATVTAGSSDDVWAGGTDFFTNGALIEHWDGRQWKRMATPAEAGPVPEIVSIGYVSADDVWAYGQNFGEAKGASGQFFAMHWNGRRWSDVPDGGAVAEALDAVTASDAWRVGFEGANTLAEHWNGRRWKQVATVTPAAGGYLTHVTAISSDDVWATGNVDGGRHRTFTEHWDGSDWSLVHDGLDSATLETISGTASDDVWIGGTGDGIGDSSAVLRHWTGHAWHPVGSPADSLNGASVNGISALTSTDTWAVGTYVEVIGGVEQFRRCLMHWDGSTWTRSQQR